MNSSYETWSHIEIAKMIYEAWEICELITNFAYEENGREGRMRKSSEKSLEETITKPSHAMNMCVSLYRCVSVCACMRVTGG